MEDSINDSKIYEIAPPASYDLINYSSKLIIDNINTINIISKLKNNLNENFDNLNHTKITIPFNDLKILKKKYLIKLIEFIQNTCNIFLQKKFIFCFYSIFKVIKDKKNNFYEIVIDNNNKEEIFEDIIEGMDENKKENFENHNKIICKEEKEFLNNKNIINDENNKDKNEEKEGNFVCESHNLKFGTLKKYHNHCKKYFEKMICKKCGNKYTKLKTFRKHLCKKEINSNNLNNNIINSNIKLNEEKNENIKSEMIKCSECDLIFHNIESMSLHFFEIHEKYKRDNLIKNEIKKSEENINIKKNEIEDKLNKRLEMIIEQDKEKDNKNDKNNKEDKINIKQLEIEKNAINNINKEVKNEEMLKREEDVKKQEEIIVEELLKRKNEKIHQGIIDEKVKKKIKMSKKEKRQLKKKNKEIYEKNVIYDNNKKNIDEVENEKILSEKEKRLNEEYKKFREAKRERLLKRQERTELNENEKKFLKEMELEENENEKKELNKEGDNKNKILFKFRSPIKHNYICDDCNKSFLQYDSMVSHCKAKKHSGY